MHMSVSERVGRVTEGPKIPPPPLLLLFLVEEEESDPVWV